MVTWPFQEELVKKGFVSLYIILYFLVLFKDDQYWTYFIPKGKKSMNKSLTMQEEKRSMGVMLSPQQEHLGKLQSGESQLSSMLLSLVEVGGGVGVKYTAEQS